MKISEILKAWYKINMRSLPWRTTSDPYLIWLSEIILQQTRVSQGISYYLKFSERFPSVELLADASEEEVLNLWQGLGYYSRARNLQFAARQIVNDFDGQFPESYASLLQLKGIGTYTASAISSIAYHEPVAVVDGNVARVLSRLFVMEDPINSSGGVKHLQTLADEILDRKDPGTHNQAMMEFGALQCVPLSPNCEACTLQAHCLAYKEGKVSHLPVKIKKVKIRKRYFYYLVLEQDGHSYIRKRTGDDIWKSLYEYPMLEVEAELDDDVLFERMLQFSGLEGFKLELRKISGSIRHQLTHRTIFAKFVHVEVNSKGFDAPGDWVKIREGDIGEYPLPRLIDRYLG